MTLREAVELLLEYIRRAESSGLSHRIALDRVRRLECGARLLGAVHLAERELSVIRLRYPELYRLMVSDA